MAVKPEIIKARLKVLFPKANLSTKRLDVYAAKLAPKPADDADDEAIDAIINDYNEVIDFAVVAAEDDRIRTLEADKKKAEEAVKNKGGKEEEEEETEGMTPFEKRMLKNFGVLKSDIDSIKSGNVLETKKQTALQSFEKSEILKGLKPELKGRWLTRIDVNSETPIEDQIKELESEYSELVQVNADSNVYGGPAGGGLNNTKPDESIVSEIVDNLNI
ncbi:hypothetical protein IUY40_02725 [Flavobacterium sp. ALJ2]|uniref:hypothetical protein n=1 Tax=Flavobacterium sp. ALJ2 TaxID=2786960 RepID=UPI00189EEA9E|nr:hypothetical protein [Flavobacterium sp. ALJ2]MBF7090459.1 hypothetical protein [Flavobacterium sp. ALJ2]